MKAPVVPAVRPSLLLDRRPTTYRYAPITYHDSWLSIDPIVGCSLNCHYCYMRHAGWTGVRPEVLIDPAAVVDLLEHHPYFTRDQTILSFGNHTDPFLEPNVPRTLQFVEALVRKGLRNPLCLVTKKSVPASFRSRVGKLDGPPLVFFITYSGLPAEIELGANPSEIRGNFAKLRDDGFPVVHYWRPLLKRNGTSEILRHVLDHVVSFASASVYVGAKLTPTLLANYAASTWLRSEHLPHAYGEHIPPDVEQRLRALAAERYPSYPLYKHASCAVSLVLGIPDYNATFFNKPICLGSNCPESKRYICARAASAPTPQQVDEALNRTGYAGCWRVTPSAIVLDAPVDQETYVFLLHRWNYPIDAAVLRTRNVWGSIMSSSSRLEIEGADASCDSTRRQPQALPENDAHVGD